MEPGVKLYVLAEKESPRLKYTLRILLGQLLGLNWEIRPPGGELPSGAPVIDYTTAGTGSGFRIPPSGFLERRGVLEENALSFDLLAAAFYLLSDFEKYEESHLDRHGRYDAAQYPSASLGLDRRPLVMDYARGLGDCLAAQFPQIRSAMRKGGFRTEITVDVDQPWKYLHKGPAVFLGGLVKELLRGDLASARERLHSLRTGVDPNDSFEQLFSVCPPEKTRFFFLMGGGTRHDNRFGAKHRKYRELIRRIRDRGYGIGIHPSYGSRDDAALFEGEKESLETIPDQKILHSRQHFFRYRYPDTFRQVLKSGIRHEYSLCLFQTGGFPCGMAEPFAWYDLQAEKETELMLHPTQLMDRTLIQYLELDPDAALESMSDLLGICQEVGGTFTLLIHNDALSESGEWQGWRNCFLKILHMVADA